MPMPLNLPLPLPLPLRSETVALGRGILRELISLLIALRRGCEGTGRGTGKGKGTGKGRDRRYPGNPG